MIALGIDPGTSRDNPCGLALVRWQAGAELPELLVAQALGPPRPDAGADATIRRIALYLDEWITAYPRPDCAGVECAHVQVNAQSALRLAEVVGVVLSFCARHAVPLARCQPAQAKLALAGSGAADKAAMMRAAHVQFGATLSKDTADAVGVALYALSDHRRQLLGVR